MGRLILLLMVMISGTMAWGQASAQNYRYPTPEEQKIACGKTGGRWETLPDYCDNMHPRSWKKLNEKQQIICLDRFNEPCECGAGRRFSTVNVLGCIKSNFPEDRKAGDPSFQ